MDTKNAVGVVQSYIDKHSLRLPSPVTDSLSLSAGKLRVKGSELDEWRKNGTKGGSCGQCGVFVDRLTVDHIIPLSILADLDNAFEIAVNDSENFQYLCEICNRRKSGHIDIRDPRTARLLAKYIAPYL